MSRIPDLERASAHLASALEALGFGNDVELDDTPRRVAEYWASLAPEPPPPLSPTHTSTTAPVVVRGIPFHSMCVHHLLPFFGTAAVGYRPEGTVVGLGSIPRTVQHLSRGLQLQERLADAIADTLQAATGASSLVVALRARHMCVEMRGASSPADVLVVAERGAPDPWLRAQVESP